MKKAFLIKKGESIYCSHCGKFLFNDEYDIKRHEKIEHIHFVNKLPGTTVEDLFRYSLIPHENSLELNILKAVSVPDSEIPVWNKIYECFFFPDTKKYEEKGEKDLKEWLEYMECYFLIDNITYIENLSASEIADTTILNKVFSGIGTMNMIEFIKMYLKRSMPNRIFEEKELRKIQQINQT